jgi:hypothetical protein
MIVIAMVPLLKSRKSKENDKDNYMGRFTINKGETIEFYKGTKLTFDRHSHKDMMVGEPTSPLIVRVTYEFKGKREECSFNTEPSSKREYDWIWQDFAFYILEYDYDRYMKLLVKLRSEEEYE